MDHTTLTPTVTFPPGELPPGVTAENASHPYLFLVLAAHRPLLEPSRHCLTDLDRIVIGRGQAGSLRSLVDGRRCLRITVPDPAMSSTHAQLIQMMGRWAIEDTGSRNGTLINGAPIQRALLGDHDLIECGQTFFVFRSDLEGPDGDHRVEPRALTAMPVLATLLPGLARDLAKLTKLAASSVSVMIQGESGTGKELVARAVHDLSGRKGPFVAVNCGALPATLLESELFGHRKGAFSGAHEDRPGLLRSADHGTLLLDEIGDLPLGSQVAFLRALEERQVVPVGGGRPVPVDLRLCAATHRRLDALVSADQFRGDLMARLAGFTLHLPPLRERREDIGLIIGALLERVAGPRAAEIGFTREAARALFAHSWPLNIRELLKYLEPAVVLAEKGPIHLDHLPPGVRATTPTSTLTVVLPSEPPTPPAFESDEARRATLAALVAEHQGNISAIARVLGRDRALIRRWLRRYQLLREK